MYLKISNNNQECNINQKKEKMFDIKKLTNFERNIINSLVEVGFTLDEMEEIYKLASVSPEEYRRSELNKDIAVKGYKRLLDIGFMIRVKGNCVISKRESKKKPGTYNYFLEVVHDDLGPLSGFATQSQYEEWVDVETDNVTFEGVGKLGIDYQGKLAIADPIGKFTEQNLL